jgi:hypothetical protein
MPQLSIHYCGCLPVHVNTKAEDNDVLQICILGLLIVLLIILALALALTLALTFTLISKTRGWSLGALSLESGLTKSLSQIFSSPSQCCVSLGIFDCLWVFKKNVTEFMYSNDARYNRILLRLMMKR